MRGTLSTIVYISYLGELAQAINWEQQMFFFTHYTFQITKTKIWMLVMLCSKRPFFSRNVNAGNFSKPFNTLISVKCFPQHSELKCDKSQFRSKGKTVISPRKNRRQVNSSSSNIPCVAPCVAPQEDKAILVAIRLVTTFHAGGMTVS